MNYLEIYANEELRSLLDDTLTDAERKKLEARLEPGALEKSREDDLWNVRSFDQRFEGLSPEDYKLLFHWQRIALQRAAMALGDWDTRRGIAEALSALVEASVKCEAHICRQSPGYAEICALVKEQQG